MKETGIVRRIEECGIIGQKSTKPHKNTGGWGDFKEKFLTKVAHFDLYIAKAR